VTVELCDNEVALNSGLGEQGGEIGAFGLASNRRSNGIGKSGSGSASW
jgi:hypothetical protein